jgi:hypothetical protein
MNLLILVINIISIVIKPNPAQWPVHGSGVNLDQPGKLKKKKKEAYNSGDYFPQQKYNSRTSFPQQGC